MPKRWVEVDCFVHTTVLCEGTFSDWPANIQDGLAQALYEKCVADDRKYEAIRIFSGKDFDDKPYVRCIAGCMVDD